MARVHIDILGFVELRMIPRWDGRESLTTSELEDFDAINKLGEGAGNIIARPLLRLREQSVSLRT